MSGNENRYHVDVEVVSEYVADHSEPDDDRYVFAYTVTIRNLGSVPAQLVARHWLVTDADGHVEEVRGPGVVGEQPRIEPGEGFRYTSAAAIATPVGSMHGSYAMIADDGTEFDATIPAFGLAIPGALH